MVCVPAALQLCGNGLQCYGIDLYLGARMKNFLVFDAEPFCV